MPYPQDGPVNLSVADIEACVDAILARVGEHVMCATPLGLGKPVPLLNALYARVKANPALHLSIHTALSLEVPRASGELERRFLDPYLQRTFAGVPALDYLGDLRADTLPPNIEIRIMMTTTITQQPPIPKPPLVARALCPPCGRAGGWYA